MNKTASFSFYFSFIRWCLCFLIHNPEFLASFIPCEFSHSLRFFWSFLLDHTAFVIVKKVILQGWNPANWLDSSVHSYQSARFCIPWNNSALYVLISFSTILSVILLFFLRDFQFPFFKDPSGSLERKEVCRWMCQDFSCQPTTQNRSTLDYLPVSFHLQLFYPKCSTSLFLHSYF